MSALALVMSTLFFLAPMLLACSDGLLELTSSDGEVFGIDRTASLLSGAGGCPTAILAALTAAIGSFHDLDRLDGDLTFIALYRQAHE
jgi:serine phosphatase RsbU (regulator of sigma subunit)